MPACSWCGRMAIYRDNKLHFACLDHRQSLQEAVRDHDVIAAEYSRSQRAKDKYDLSR